MFNDLFTELAKELKDCDPMDRSDIALGYAKHAEAIHIAELKKCLATYDDDPSLFREVLESRIKELETGKAPYDKET